MSPHDSIFAPERIFPYDWIFPHDRTFVACDKYEVWYEYTSSTLMISWFTMVNPQQIESQVYDYVSMLNSANEAMAPSD